MAELLGLLSAIDQLLETAIRSIARLRKAYERQKGLAKVFDGHLEELSHIRRIIRSVQSNSALRTTDVATSLQRLKRAEDKLVAHLKLIDPQNRGPLRQFSHQLTRGSSDQRTLAEIVSEVSQAKLDLSLSIGLAHVAVTQTIQGAVVMERENDRRSRHGVGQMTAGKNKNRGETFALHEEIVQERELVRRTKQSTAKASDRMSFSSSDVDSEPSMTEGSQSDVASSASELPASRPDVRINVNNMTEADAFLNNGTIGEMATLGPRRIENRGNIAKGTSVQNNGEVNLGALEMIFKYQMAVRNSKRG